MLSGHSRQSIPYPTIFWLYQKNKKTENVFNSLKNPCKGREGQIGRVGLTYIHYHVLNR